MGPQGVPRWTKPRGHSVAPALASYSGPARAPLGIKAADPGKKERKIRPELPGHTRPGAQDFRRPRPAAALGERPPSDSRRRARSDWAGPAPPPAPCSSPPLGPSSQHAGSPPGPSRWGPVCLSRALSLWRAAERLVVPPSLSLKWSFSFRARYLIVGAVLCLFHARC